MLTAARGQTDAHARRLHLLASFGSPKDPASAARVLAALVGDSLDDLAQPASGGTLQRWRTLSEVASFDLSVAKLFESHTDALAILKELGDCAGFPRGSTCGVWAAEVPDARVIVSRGIGTHVTLTGRKAWCSGAAHLSHALMTVWCADGTGPFLAKVHLQQEGVRVSREGWNAVGMAATASVDVHFAQAAGTVVGDAEDYLSRPGFWHGGAGIAACWYGGSVRLAQSLRDAVRLPAGGGSKDFRHAALGKVDLALKHTAALLRAAAGWIDAHPREDASALTIRVRMSAEDCATQVMHQTARALGAVPFCKDEGFARMAADLPVFIRQSGGERDACAVGESVAADDNRCWEL